jgi:hypothetical protein
MPCGGKIEARIEQAKSSLLLEKYSTGKKDSKAGGGRTEMKRDA